MPVQLPFKVPTLPMVFSLQTEISFSQIALVYILLSSVLVVGSGNLEKEVACQLLSRLSYGQLRTLRIAIDAANS